MKCDNCKYKAVYELITIKGTKGAAPTPTGKIQPEKKDKEKGRSKKRASLQ